MHSELIKQLLSDLNQSVTPWFALAACSLTLCLVFLAKLLHIV